SDRVFSIALSGTTLYAGGKFDLLRAVTRNRIAAIDITTGLPTAWDPNADDRVNALVANGGTIYAGGEFSKIGGQARPDGVAALSATTGLATAWNPSPGGILGVTAMTLAGSRLVFGGYTAPLSQYLFRADTTTALVSAFGNCNGYVYSLVLSG